MSAATCSLSEGMVLASIRIVPVLQRAERPGLHAETPEEFLARDPKVTVVCDSILFSHVLEHMAPNAARELVEQYLPCLKPDGQVIFSTPQEPALARARHTFRSSTDSGWLHSPGTSG